MTRQREKNTHLLEEKGVKGQNRCQEREREKREEGRLIDRGNLDPMRATKEVEQAWLNQLESETQKEERAADGEGWVTDKDFL